MVDQINERVQISQTILMLIHRSIYAHHRVIKEKSVPYLLVAL